jgi:peroxiredoxin
VFHRSADWWQYCRSQLVELEQSRAVLEKEGLRIAAVSYDSEETLRAFAGKYQIRFPLLSDRDSAVIRSFGIFNTNIAPGLRAHGVPHPVEYLVTPDGVVIRKYFVPNYQHRVTASAVVLREFGVSGNDAPRVTLQSGAAMVTIGLSTAEAFAGQELAFFAKFTMEPGWHVYPDTSVTFDDPKIIRQSFEFGEELQGLGTLLLKFPLDAGKTTLSGQVRFQQCSETVCEPPETIPFELPLTLEPFVVAKAGVP